MVTERIKISKIKRLEKIQPRVAMDMSYIDECAKSMMAGEKFPAADVFKEGDKYFLVDGFHRIEAAKRAHRVDYPCKVHEGSKRDAILFACGANATHGLRRTDEDKCRAVERLLTDATWSTWSDSDIAEKCRVSRSFVSKIRRASCHDSKMPTVSPTRKVRRGGKTYDMKTGRIGGKRKSKQPGSDEPPSLPVSPCPVEAQAVAMDVPAQSQPELPADPLQQPEISPPEQAPPPDSGQPAGMIEREVPVSLSPLVFSTDICKAGICPDGKWHYVMNQRLNRMECDQTGIEITQMSKCPLLVQREKNDAVTTSITPKPVVEIPDREPEESECRVPLPVTSTQRQPLNHTEKEELADQFVAACLSPQHSKLLEDLIEMRFCDTYLAAIVKVIDMVIEETGATDIVDSSLQRGGDMS